MAAGVDDFGRSCTGRAGSGEPAAGPSAAGSAEPAGEPAVAGSAVSAGDPSFAGSAVSAGDPSFAGSAVSAGDPSFDLSGVAGCRSAAERLLAGMPRRWSHVRGVAEWAGELAEALHLGPSAAGRLLRAAWLHDVGYAEGLRWSGFHPLDGARWIRAQGEEQLARLVAHHSAAGVEARLRGLSLDAFPPQRGVAPLLDYADICTGPGGERVAPARRLAEVLERYPPGHPTHEALRISRSARLARAARVAARLAAAAGEASAARR